MGGWGMGWGMPPGLPPPVTRMCGTSATSGLRVVMLPRPACWRDRRIGPCYRTVLDSERA
eukprot:6115885-Pyramimonas_sp.AAC.1